jgi:hypothetical protein
MRWVRGKGRKAWAKGNEKEKEKKNEQNIDREKKRKQEETNKSKNRSSLGNACAKLLFHTAQLVAFVLVFDLATVTFRLIQCLGSDKTRVYKREAYLRSG